MSSLTGLLTAVLAITSLSSCSPYPQYSSTQFAIAPAPPKDCVCHTPCSCIPPDKKPQSKYVCGVKRLGLTVEPERPVVRSLMADYVHFGGLNPCQYFVKWQKEGVTDQIDWDYPQKDGFELDSDQNPLRYQFKIKVDTLVDRFGPESGKYLSPKDTPLAFRALPPASLADQDYHVYKVLEEFTVWAGTVVPHFDQPGQGVQYFLGDHGAERVDRTVEQLVQQGILKEVFLGTEWKFPQTFMLGA